LIERQLQARIIILNYNGAELLPKCLPSIVEAARNAKCPTQITVLDNLGPDSGLDYVAKNFPDVTIVKSESNRVLCSYNDYLPKIQEPIAILLNNDIRVDPNFIDPLIQKFKEDPKTFLVAPRVMSFDGTKTEAGASRAGIRFGFFWCDARYRGYEQEVDRASETFSSGFGAFSREHFIALGGYDDLYLPGILEDVDLCYKAKRTGLHLYYEPKSVVYHMGQASFKKKYGSLKISILAHRNNFLFMWKNFHGIGFWMKHLFFLPLRLLYALLKGNWGMILGFGQAVQLAIFHFVQGDKKGRFK
jgi:N-acetylglucosaminyl-diphospho-decaprenol L-rhamnosyltransferase